MPQIPLSFPFHKGKDPPDAVTVKGLGYLTVFCFII